LADDGLRLPEIQQMSDHKHIISLPLDALNTFNLPVQKASTRRHWF